MIRTISAVLLTAMLSSTGLAAGKKQPSSTPTGPIALQDMETNIGTMMAPAAPMAMPEPPPLSSPQFLLEGLSAIKGSPDGSQTEVGTPPRVKRMLMKKQSGMIDGGNKKKEKKKKTNRGDLKQIGDTGKFPYTTIGVVASGCSGTLVMKRFVLTAAWCVYDLKAKQFYKNLDFIPAMNGKKTPFGRVKWKNAWVTKGFAEKGDLKFGYGLIELDQEIGDKIGWFGFGPVPQFNFKRLTLTGYPLSGAPDPTMWQTVCRIDAAEENAIFYKCPGNGDSLTAMLGAPLWFKGKADNAWQIVGIHVAPQTNDKNSWWAARLNAAHTETILGWATSADKKDQGTDEEDQGTDDDVADDETDDDNVDVVDNPDCVCDDQAQPN